MAKKILKKNFFFCVWIYLVWTFYIPKWNHTILVFCVWLFSSAYFQGFIHVAACVRASLTFYDYYSHPMYRLHFVYPFSHWRTFRTFPSATDGQSGHFHLLAIVNSAATSIHIHVFEHLFQYRQEWKCWLTGLISCLTFWGTTKLLPTVPAPFYIPTSSVQGSNFSISLTTFLFFFL